MGRGKGTQLATTDGATSGELNNKPTITKSAATNMVRQLAASMYRDAQREVKAKRDRLVSQVGSVDRVDDSVIADAERLMTRVALIARKKADRYASSGNAALESIVKKLGGVVGELRAFMLTNASIGLFEQLDEDDYRARVYTIVRDNDPLLYAGPKVRERAEALLANYTIVDDPKPEKKGAKNAKPAHVGVICHVCGCTDGKPCNPDCDPPDADSDVCGYCRCLGCDAETPCEVYDGEMLCPSCAPLDDGEDAK